jgi:two-component system response regulator DesR
MGYVKPATLGAPLSRRELDVLKLMCAGRTLKAIAIELHLSNGSIGMYRARITQKTGTTSSAQLGVWAVRNRVVELEPTGASE